VLLARVIGCLWFHWKEINSTSSREMDENSSQLTQHIQ
jgi:hypothetical protein